MDDESTTACHLTSQRVPAETTSPYQEAKVVRLRQIRSIALCDNCCISIARAPSTKELAEEVQVEDSSSGQQFNTANKSDLPTTHTNIHKLPPKLITMPDCLEDYRIKSLPGSAYYVPNFVTEEEERVLLNKVGNHSRNLVLATEPPRSRLLRSHDGNICLRDAFRPGLPI